MRPRFVEDKAVGVEFRGNERRKTDSISCWLLMVEWSDRFSQKSGPVNYSRDERAPGTDLS